MAVVPFVSVEEYLAMEEVAETRHEYMNGEVRMMSGGTANHSRLIFSVASALHTGLADASCEGFSSETRVRNPRGNYFYPDVSVACDPIFTENQTTLLNPVLVVEVLSPTTESYDRGVKFDEYATIPSLTEIVFVSQDLVRVERYTRSGSGWLLEVFLAGDEFTAAGVALRVDDLYRRVRPQPTA